MKRTQEFDTAARATERELCADMGETLADFRRVLLRVEEMKAKERKASGACGYRLGEYLMQLHPQPGVCAALGILSRLITRDAAERMQMLLNISEREQ